MCEIKAGVCFRCDRFYPALQYRRWETASGVRYGGLICPSCWIYEINRINRTAPASMFFAPELDARIRRRIHEMFKATSDDVWEFDGRGLS